MTFETNPETIQHHNSHILFDASLISQPDDKIFSIEWLQQHCSIQATESGRGESWFIQPGDPNFKDQQWVLRHYLRGGMVAKINRDLYFAWQTEHSRAWKEWRLLHHMYALGLPVPRPIAARAYWPAGRSYGLHRADILLQRIPQCSNLDKLLQKQSLPDALWHNIGHCLKTFHTHDIYHADLNANNILIDTQQKIYLIDFDRGYVTHRSQLKTGNLSRLHRSLLKLQRLHSTYNFTEKNWQLLLAGYNDNRSA